MFFGCLSFDPIKIKQFSDSVIARVYKRLGYNTFPDASPATDLDLCLNRGLAEEVPWAIRYDHTWVLIFERKV